MNKKSTQKCMHVRIKKIKKFKKKLGIPKKKIMGKKITNFGSI